MQLQESFRALKGHIKGRFQWIAIAQLFLRVCCMKISMEKPSHSKMYLPVRHGDFRFAMLVFWEGICFGSLRKHGKTNRMAKVKNRFPVPFIEMKGLFTHSYKGFGNPQNLYIIYLHILRCSPKIPVTTRE